MIYISVGAKVISNAEIEFINKLSFVFMKIYIKKKYDFK